MDFKDTVLSYGVIHGKRFTEKEKKNFLYTSQIEFDKMGYNTNVLKSDLKLRMNQSVPHYNLYVGDVGKADVIITTYYDTATKLLDGSKVKAFGKGNSKGSLIIQTVFIFLLLLVLSLFGYYFLVPMMQESGILSFPGIITILYLLLSFAIINKLSRGIPNRYNFVRNTSSLMAMFELANNNKNNKIAYAFVDGGSTTNYGLNMLKDLTRQNAKIVYLDAIANPGPMQVFAKKEFKQFTHHKHDSNDLADVLITFGKEEKGDVFVPNANTNKDDNIDETTYKDNLKELQSFLKTYFYNI